MRPVGLININTKECKGGLHLRKWFIAFKVETCHLNTVLSFSSKGASRKSWSKRTKNLDLKPNAPAQHGTHTPI